MNKYLKHLLTGVDNKILTMIKIYSTSVSRFFFTFAFAKQQRMHVFSLMTISEDFTFRSKQIIGIAFAFNAC